MSVRVHLYIRIHMHVKCTRGFYYVDILQRACTCPFHLGFQELLFPSFHRMMRLILEKVVI